jgi:hypothetical protein
VHTFFLLLFLFRETMSLEANRESDSTPLLPPVDRPSPTRIQSSRVLLRAEGNLPSPSRTTQRSFSEEPRRISDFGSRAVQLVSLFSPRRSKPKRCHSTPKKASQSPLSRLGIRARVEVPFTQKRSARKWMLIIALMFLQWRRPNFPMVRYLFPFL